MRNLIASVLTTILAGSLLLACSSGANNTSNMTTSVVSDKSSNTSSAAAVQLKAPNISFDFENALKAQPLTTNSQEKCVFVCDEWECTATPKDTIKCTCKRGHMECGK